MRIVARTRPPPRALRSRALGESRPKAFAPQCRLGFVTEPRSPVRAAPLGSQIEKVPDRPDRIHVARDLTSRTRREQYLSVVEGGWMDDTVATGARSRCAAKRCLVTRANFCICFSNSARPTFASEARPPCRARLLPRAHADANNLSAGVFPIGGRENAPNQGDSRC
jgi:hypothetical protein